MSDHRNQIILESLYQKYIDLGYEDAEAQELAAKEFEENQKHTYCNGNTCTPRRKRTERRADKIVCG